MIFLCYLCSRPYKFAENYLYPHPDDFSCCLCSRPDKFVLSDLYLRDLDDILFRVSTRH